MKQVTREDEQSIKRLYPKIYNAFIKAGIKIC
jgi:hypothetical protein